MTNIYICKDSFEDILCGIYEAWYSGLGHDKVKVQVENQGNLELFCQYVEVYPEDWKAHKVIQAVRKKISEEAYESIYKASLSNDENKGECIYRFLIVGFRYGSRVMDMLNLEPVFELFRICRFVTNETHLLTGFVRFSQMQKGILLSKIQPKNNVIFLLAPHFADRLSGEHWIIYDENRQLAAIHQANGEWAVIMADLEEWKSKLSEKTDEEEYQKLWKIFFQTIAIKERKNPNCQRNHLPLRYRSNMTEFQN